MDAGVSLELNISENGFYGTCLKITLLSHQMFQNALIIVLG